MKKRMVMVFMLLVISVIAVVAYCNINIVQGAKGKIYDNVNGIPYNEVGLLLGTSPLRKNGEPNPYFLYRVEASAALYNNGKIKLIVASGDNNKNEYDEPLAMRKALVDKGVPDSAIVEDGKGYRTFDSIVNAKKAGYGNFTIISQRFHDERALFLCRHLGLDCIAFTAADVYNDMTIIIQLREILAKVKAYGDIIVDFFGNSSEPR